MELQNVFEALKNALETLTNLSNNIRARSRQLFADRWPYSNFGSWNSIFVQSRDYRSRKELSAPAIPSESYKLLIQLVSTISNYNNKRV